MKIQLTSLKKAYSILSGRVNTQGVRTTLIWMSVRSVGKLTGIPILKFSRVTSQIYVGAQYGNVGKYRLESLGIHYCVNMRIEFDSIAKGLDLHNYCHLPTIDDRAPSLKHLDEGVEFIDKAVTSGGKVYIHCGGGVGRAPTMAAAYFISKGYGLEAAFALIREARPFIRPMAQQIEQLKHFEAIRRTRLHNT